MDEATLELRRKIDEMLSAADISTEKGNLPGGFVETAAARRSMAAADGGHGPLGAFHMEDFVAKGPPIRDEKEEI